MLTKNILCGYHIECCFDKKKKNLDTTFCFLLLSCYFTYNAMLSIFDTEKQVYIYQYEGHVCANKCKDSSCRSKKEQVNESFIH